MVRRAAHMRREPVKPEDMMKNAGRAVLHSTLSLILTASLVPAQATVVIAEELGQIVAQEQEQNDAPQGVVEVNDRMAEGEPATEEELVVEETVELPAEGVPAALDQVTEEPAPEQEGDTPAQVEGGEDEEAPTLTAAAEGDDTGNTGEGGDTGGTNEEPAITPMASAVTGWTFSSDTAVDGAEGVYSDVRTLTVTVDEAEYDFSDATLLVDYVDLDGTVHDGSDATGHAAQLELSVDKSGEVTLDAEGLYLGFALQVGEGEIGSLPLLPKDSTETGEKQFVVDKSAPAAEKSHTFRNNAITNDATTSFTYTVTDAALDTAKSSVTVNGTAVTPTFDEYGMTATYTVDVSKDGEYAIATHFVDALDQDSTLEENYAFTIDRTAPKATATAEGESTDWWGRTSATYTVTISDANLDESKTVVFGKYTLESIIDNVGIGSARAWHPKRSGLTFSGLTVAESEGVTTYSFTVVAENIKYQGVIASAKDLAGNTGDSSSADIDIDTTAPTITSAKVSSANATKKDNADNNNDAALADGYLFFNDAKATLELEITDMSDDSDSDSGIASVTLVDPSGNYAFTTDSQTSCAEGKSITVKIALKEDVALEAPSYTTTTTTDADGNTTETKTHTSGILITITDGKGNVRVWSLASTGEITQGDNTDPIEVDNEAITNIFDGSGKEYNKQESQPYFYPSKLMLDATAPVISSLTGATAGEFYNSAAQTISLVVDEKHLADIVKYDSARPVLTVTKDGVEAQVFTVSDLTDGKLDVDMSQYGDGLFSTIAKLTDLAGNVSTQAGITDFTIDTTAPIFTVTYDNDDVKGTLDGTNYYDGVRTATVQVTEHNFDPDRMTVNVSASGWVASDPVVSDWTSEGDVHTCTVAFVEGGTYQLSVSGTDKAGNAARLDSADGETTYSATPFVVDLTTPTIETDWETVKKNKTGDLDGVLYFADEQQITVTVKDRNLDLETSTILVDGSEVPADSWSTSVADDDTVTYTYVAYYSEGEVSTPEVDVVDLASHKVAIAAEDFVVDLTAPEIDSVTVDNAPVTTGADKDSNEDVIQFYNKNTTMTFQLSDTYRIDTVELVDPDGQYVIAKDASGVKRGAKTGTIVVSLEDGANASNDTELERDVYMMVTDIAGNYRIWRISSTGEVKAVGTSDASNTSINGSGVYPWSLIKDVVAPVTALSGVTAGAYYNSAQTVHATVDEFNFAYLQRFDGSRAVLHITKYSGDASRTMTTYEISASQFSGSGSSWSWDEVFGEDGHYVVEASFSDYADNASNVSRIEEFTVDMTAPVITVEWDNNDVRNGMYYNATRTATITVTEHNFDASQFNIDTTGSIGGWASSGDVHTCTVFFDEGASHNLTVGGQDLAGNAAETVTEPEFVVDLTAPEITFGGVAQRLGFTGAEDEYNSTLEPDSAYNGVVAPSITFTDEQNFDTAGTEFTLTGNKVGDVSSDYDYAESFGTNSETVQFDDFGKQDGEATAYDVNADDIYTINAHMTDLAGNDAEGTITFSVNRFGSNYVVTVQEGAQTVDLTAASILDEAPTITVREINVSGAKSEAAHNVMKEYANATTEIQRQDNGSSEGYRLDTLDRQNTAHGWAEYVYTIRSANFGEGSSSDTGDGGQGIYRVNVASDDTASNVNTTADYWSSDTARTQASAKVGTAEFTLDEVGPVIDETDLPDFLAPGSEYQASFHVTDAITQGNQVEVYVDGERVAISQGGTPIADGDYVGEGVFEFLIPAKSFASRKVQIKVTDYAGRSNEAGSGGFFVTTLIPEGAAALAVAGAVAGGVIYARKKRADEDESIYNDGSLLK